MPHTRIPETWSDFDHMEVAALEDPVPVMSKLKAQCPVGHSNLYGGFYILTRHADCTAAARDPRFSSSTKDGKSGPGFPYGDAINPITMINDDGQRHRDFKGPMQKLMSVDFAKAQEDRIREICRNLVDGFIERGEADLAQEFTMELPAILICELLDLPGDRRREFQGWASEIVATGNPELVTKMADYVHDLYDIRVKSPGDDLPSKVLELKVEGRPISRIEWEGMIMLLIMGGLDTTANGGAHALFKIGKEPELRRYLLEDFSRIPAASNELIRLICPVPNHSRTVTADVEIGGHTFHKGDVVELSWLAANHDPEVFENPDDFNPNRKPPHHLGFGFGPHRCLGANLAIVEMNVMLEEILSRLPDYEVIDEGVKQMASINRAMTHLPVRFSPGKQSEGA